MHKKVCFRAAAIFLAAFMMCSLFLITGAVPAALADTGPLAAPSDLAGIGTAQAPGFVRLAWVDNATSAHSIVLERRIQGAASWDVIATVASNQQEYVDTYNLVQPNIYEYRAKAVGFGNPAPESGYSSIIAVSYGETLLPHPKGTKLKFIVGSTTYYVDDVAYLMDVEPYIYNNRIFLPVTRIVDPLGGTASWTPDEQKVTIEFYGKTIELWVNSNIVRVNGVDDVADSSDPTITPVSLPPGRVFIPVRIVTVSMGCYTMWDGDEHAAIIEYPNPNNP